MFIPVRQVIPIIRGNDTQLTGSAVNTLAGKKKRDVSDADPLARIHGDKIDYDKWRRPEFARSTDRAARSPKEPLESRILSKQARYLRLVGLKEVEMEEGRVKRKAFVPR